MHPLFRWLSRFVVVPLYRMRLGFLIANPVSGYLMVVRTAGRRTGRVRHAAVMYALGEGDVYCMAGWGPGTDWYRNAVARPQVTVILPGRAVQGAAEDLIAPAERAAALRRILKNSGLTAFTEGVNPWRDSDETILARAELKPVVRIRPLRGPVTAGPFDPGGPGWLVGPLAATGAVLVILAVSGRIGAQGLPPGGPAIDGPVVRA